MEYLIAILIGYFVFKSLIGSKKNYKKDVETAKTKSEMELENQLSKIKNKRSDDVSQNIPKDNNESSQDSKNKISSKSLIIFLSLLIGVGFYASTRTSETISSVNNSSKVSSSSSICTTWVKSTADNAADFASVIDSVVSDLQKYENNSITKSQIESALFLHTNKLERIEANQGSLTPNSTNGSSNEWFILAIDNLINGVYYIGKGIETDYLPTLESGIEFVDMAIQNLGKSTERLNSC